MCTMMQSSAALFLVMVASGNSQQMSGLSLTVMNNALSRVTLMDGFCKYISETFLEAGDHFNVSLSQGVNQILVVPEGCASTDCSCSSGCLGCFYIDPNVGNGVAVTGIGYGANSKVTVHDGIYGTHFSAINQLGEKESVECNSTSCDVDHIIQAHSNMVFTLEGAPDQTPTPTTTVQPMQDLSLTLMNNASSRVTLMDGLCKSISDTFLEAGDHFNVSLSQGANKIFFVPEGSSDCLGSFYIDPNVGNGVAVTGIGYGANSKVTAHDGIYGARFSAVNQLGEKESVECDSNSCNVDHIIQAHSNMVFTLEDAPNQVLTLKNAASTRVSLQDMSCESISETLVEAGDQFDVPLWQGAPGKIWVIPEGCVGSDCSCKLGCLGCFYINPNVGADGVAVTGIGYGASSKVTVHDGIYGAHFSAMNQVGEIESVECNSDSCDVYHTIQAHSNMVFTLEGAPDQTLSQKNAVATRVFKSMGSSKYVLV